MPRVQHVKKARKDHGRCRSCSVEIKKGDEYYHYSFRFGPRYVHCSDHRPKASDLTQSDKLARAYGAQETLAEAIETARVDLSMAQDELVADLPDFLASIEATIAAEIETAELEVRDVAYEYEESADNIEEYFDGSPQIDDIREKAYACEDYCDQITSIDLDFDSISNAESSLDELETANEIIL